MPHYERNSWLRLGISMLAALVLPSLAFAGDVNVKVEKVDASAYPQIKIYVSVLNDRNEPIEKLGASDFEIVEEGASDGITPIEVSTFKDADQNMAVAFVLDRSMLLSGKKLVMMRNAVNAFIDNMREGDQALLVLVSEEIDVAQEWTDKLDNVQGVVKKIKSEGFNRMLWDGVNKALNEYAEMAPTEEQIEAGEVTFPERKAVIIISNGKDGGSTVTMERCVKDALAQGIPVHSIGYPVPLAKYTSTLEELSTETSGLFQIAKQSSDFGPVFGSILDYMNTSYIITYEAVDIDSDGKVHALSVVASKGSSEGEDKVEFETPVIKSYLWLYLTIGGVLLLIIIILIVKAASKEPPPPPKVCRICGRNMMPEWEHCMFCMKEAQARLVAMRGAGKGETYPLVGKVVTLGSNESNMIVLQDPAVSGKHAGIEIVGQRYELVDLNSTNGTFVNDRRVERRFLHEGDVIMCGTTEMKFETNFDG